MLSAFSTFKPFKRFPTQLVSNPNLVQADNSLLVKNMLMKIFVKFSNFLLISF